MFKCTVFLLLAGCLQLSANSFGQKITLSKKQVSLAELFVDIHKQTGYYFFYNQSALEKSRRVDIKVRQASLLEVLEYCFRNQPLQYEIDQQVIIVKPKQSHSTDTDTSYYALQGKVLNESGEAIINATVKLMPGGMMGMTDEQGTFQIPAKGKTEFLQVSCVGYVSQRVGINTNSPIVIILRRMDNKLDEVRVIAYGTSTRRYATGNVARISSEEIVKQPVANPLSAMQGRVAGLYIQQNTGVPGGGFSVQLRGQNSIRENGNNLFYLVDGVPMPSSSIASFYTSTVIDGGNPLSALNPADIESIEILKDAEATAIYGARGANGVVLITTKKGKAGKTSVNLNTYQGWAKVASKMDLLSTPEYISMRKEAFLNDGAEPQFYDYDLLQWGTTRYTDWQEELVGGTARIQQYDLSLSGGSALTTFLLSSSYRHETTVFPGDFADKKGSIHFNVRHQSSDSRFHMSMGASYVMDRNNLVSADLLSSALTLSPNAPALYNPDGSLNWEGSTWFNPLAFTRQSYLGRTRQLLSNVDLGYKFSKHWQARVTGGYNSQRLEEDNLQPSSSYNPVWAVPGFAVFSTNEQNTWLVEPQLLFNHQKGRWQFDALIGSSLQETHRTGQRIDARNFSSDAVISNPAAAGSVNVLDVVDTRYRYASAYGRVKLDWDRQLLLSLTGRRDGSSRFGPGKQFGIFGAVGAGWLISNANWFPKKVISYAKLRASYGSTGNDQIDDYGYLSLWRFANYPYDGMPALQPQNLSNPDYRWETNRKAEAGIEVGAWKDRVLLSVSYYRNRSDNQLLGYPLPLVTGFPTVQYNLPAELQNSGWELELSSVNLQRDDWNWSTSANLSFPRRKLLSYPGLEGSAYGRDYMIGEPINIRRSLQHIGVDPTTGTYQFEDVDKDGQIRFPADAQTWRPMYVKAFAGLSNQLKFKNWLLDVFLQGVVQKGYNFQRYFQMPGTSSNQPRYVLDRWKEPGDQANYQSYSQSYGSVAYAAFALLSIYGDDIIGDASFVRLKNVSLSYSLPVNLLRRIRCQQWQFYAQGQNLLTWTNYKGLDPETMRHRNLPPLKTWAIGTRFTF